MKLNIQHLFWMIENMPDTYESQDKYNRWLGFLQGCLWAMGLRTIDEMREDNIKYKGLETINQVLKENFDSEYNLYQSSK